MEIFTKYTCVNCQEEITGIGILCHECTDEYTSCLACFSSGAETGSHRNSHSYKFIDTGTLSIFRGKNGWSAKEELHLLDAIEQYGYGNWQDISKHIETKSPEDAKEEYISKFLHGTIGRHTWGPEFENRPVLKDHTRASDTTQIARSQTEKLPPLDILPDEAQQLGYLPHREDFEVEYDAAAEKIVSNLLITPDDEDVDLLVKLTQIHMYTRRLKERARRKKLVRDYQLAAQFFRGSNAASRRSSNKSSKEQKDFRDRFRVFAQFYTSSQYERLLYSLEGERTLRNRLQELTRYRKSGLTKIDECIYYEQQMALQQKANPARSDISHLDAKQTTERLALLHQLSQQNKNKHGENNGELHHNNNNSDEFASKELQDVVNQTRRQLLNANEMQICSITNNPPPNYITCKAVMLASGAQRYQQPSNASEKMMKNYFSKCGWLQ
ncbi:transcriptional adapter 2B-like [Culicoides brevitarsis]|uniref:transcriptional adapter 2B-like n=1 Tax=Culicoides brevitarsis TaxID=469753 RepID=UPI00307C79C6